MKRRWTQEEELYLEEQVGKMKVSTIAEHLNRTVDSVLKKMQRLNLMHTRRATGLMTTYELADLLKVHPFTVQRWIKVHKLPALKKVTREKTPYYFIDAEKFWSWAYKNKDKIDFSQIEINSIPPEPDWVNQERREAKKASYRLWTKPETHKLLFLINKGYDYAYIGQSLGRSIDSVSRKHQRLFKEGKKIS